MIPSMGEDASVDLVQWLQEAGRRRWRPRRDGIAPTPPGARRFDPSLLRSAGLLLAGAGAVLQYCYTDTMLQILLIRSVIVFVFSGAQ